MRVIVLGSALLAVLACADETSTFPASGGSGTGAAAASGSGAGAAGTGASTTGGNGSGAGSVGGSGTGGSGGSGSGLCPAQPPANGSPCQVPPQSGGSNPAAHCSWGDDGGAPRRKAILVGHSYGGPLVARMAVDFPELVKGIVMVAPAIDPETQNALWFQRLGARKSLRWLVPRSLYSTCVELVPLREHLVVLEPHWKEIQAPTIVIQGGRDFLVPPTVADFAERQLVSAPKSIRRFPRKGHFLWWTRPEVVRKAILDLLDGKEFEI